MGVKGLEKKEMYTLKLELSKEMDCPADVVIWNYYDHEHLLGTHFKLYHEARVLAERDDWALVYRKSKIPIVPFSNAGIGFQFMDGNIMKTFHLDRVGFLLEMEVHFHDLPDDRSRMDIVYMIRVPKWMSFLQPIFEKVFSSWLDNAWAEDVPMRLRRWKVHKLGFKDFHGVDWINNKEKQPEEYNDEKYVCKLPVPSLPQIKTPEGIGRPITLEQNIELEPEDYKIEVGKY